MTIDTTAGDDLDAGTIEVLPPARPVADAAVATLMQHAETMEVAWTFASKLCGTDLVPDRYRNKPENGTAAILYGAELGLTPIQSLQQIFVVHGAPAIYARTAVALVMRHGVTVSVVSSTNDAVTVRGQRGNHTEEATWDMARAELAGYTSNKKYKTDPQAMLYAKAAMEVCRKIAPDVLLGMPFSREELEMEQPERVESRRVPSKAKGVDGLRSAITPTPEAPAADAAEPVDAETVEPQPDPEPATEPAAPAAGMSAATRKKWQNRMFVLLGEADCNDRDDQIAVIEELSGRAGLEHRDGLTDDELKAVVNRLHDESKAGNIGGFVTDLLNTIALRQSGYDAAEDGGLDFDGAGE